MPIRRLNTNKNWFLNFVKLVAKQNNFFQPTTKKLLNLALNILCNRLILQEKRQKNKLKCNFKDFFFRYEDCSQKFIFLFITLPEISLPTV